MTYPKVEEYKINKARMD